MDDPKNRDSILDIKVPIFKPGGGLPEIRSYIEDFPFPFYVLLRDINSLPFVLSDSLKQWFELVTQTTWAGSLDMLDRGRSSTQIFDHATDIVTDHVKPHRWCWEVEDRITETSWNRNVSRTSSGWPLKGTDLSHHVSWSLVNHLNKDQFRDQFWLTFSLRQCAAA